MAAPSSDFEAQYNQALELFKVFPEYQFKTVTAMLVVIGWLVSSDTAQKFIKTHPDMALPWGLAAFASLAVLKALWVYGHFARMNSLHARLKELAPMQSLSAASVAQLKMGPVLPATYVAVNTMLCIAGSMVLWAICH